MNLVKFRLTDAEYEILEQKINVKYDDFERSRILYSSIETNISILFNLYPEIITTNVFIGGRENLIGKAKFDNRKKIKTEEYLNTFIFFIWHCWSKGIEAKFTEFNDNTYQIEWGEEYVIK